MKTQEILIYDQGISGNKLVRIKVLANCPVCNNEIKAIENKNHPTTFTGDKWKSCCRERFGNYQDIWNLQIKGYPNGLSCRKCQDHFPWAEPNQDDGTLICFSCRSMGRR